MASDPCPMCATLKKLRASCTKYPRQPCNCSLEAKPFEVTLVIHDDTLSHQQVDGPGLIKYLVDQCLLEPSAEYSSTKPVLGEDGITVHYAFLEDTGEADKSQARADIDEIKESLDGIRELGAKLEAAVERLDVNSMFTPNIRHSSEHAEVIEKALETLNLYTRGMLKPNVGLSHITLVYSTALITYGKLFKNETGAFAIFPCVPGGHEDHEIELREAEDLEFDTYNEVWMYKGDPWFEDVSNLSYLRRQFGEADLD